MLKLIALVTKLNEKPYGVGRTAHERHSRIVGGWRAEVTDGLPKGQAIYTGVCASKAEARAELIGHLKAHGLSGTISFKHCD